MNRSPIKQPWPGGLYGRKAAVINGFSPKLLFAAGESGAWYSFDTLSNLYTTSAGATNVAALGDAIGLITRKAGSGNPYQSTTPKRPLYAQLPTGQYYASHDRIDDALLIDSIAAGTCTFAAATFSGVQIYPITQNASGTFTLPSVDAIEALLINRALTTGEQSSLSSYLESKAPTKGSTDILRLWCSGNSVNLAVAESVDSGSSWVLGDGQTATGVSCVKTITAPQSVVFRSSNPSAITSVNLGGKYIYGQLSDLSLLNSLVSLYLYSNQFTGSIPSLLNNPSLVTVHCASNQLTDFSGVVPSSLSSFIASSNLLTSTAVNNILAAFRAAGRASGTISLGGSGNAAPTGQGLTDKAYLQGLGWTVTTN